MLLEKRADLIISLAAATGIFFSGVEFVLLTNMTDQTSRAVAAQQLICQLIELDGIHSQKSPVFRADPTGQLEGLHPLVFSLALDRSLLPTLVAAQFELAGSLSGILTHNKQVRLKETFYTAWKRLFQAARDAGEVAAGELAGSRQGLFLTVSGELITLLALSLYALKFKEEQRLRWQRLKTLSGTGVNAGANTDEIDQIEQGILALTQSGEAKIRTVFDNAIDVICVLDIDFRFISVNSAAKTSWGYAPEELTGKKLSDFLLAEDIQSSLSEMIGAEHSLDKVSFENRLCHKDGTVIHLLWSAHWSASDRGLFCVAHDITDRKSAENMLRESETRIRSILEALPVGVLIVNEMACIEFINRSIETLTEFPYQDLLSEPLAKLFPDRLQDVSADECLTVLRASSHSAQSLAASKKSGESFPVAVTVTNFTVHEQDKILVLLVDVSERERIDQLKREFIAMVSHDVRTPLASIGLTLSYLQEHCYEQLKDRERALVQQATVEVERLSRLTKDLLDLERMESGKFSMHFQDVSMVSLIASAVGAVSRTAERRNLSIITPSTDIRCEADGGRVIQVLVNILSNAIKFSPKGKTIRVALEDLHDLVKVTTTDEGPGIPNEKTGIIFEKFLQVKESHEKSGSGLGLAICKAIVEQHQGHIGVQTTVGTGSSFWFTLPKKLVSGQLSNPYPMP